MKYWGEVRGLRVFSLSSLNVLEVDLRQEEEEREDDSSSQFCDKLVQIRY